MLRRARTLLKSALSSIQLRVAPPSARDLALLRELRTGCRELSERKIQGTSSAADTWSKVANHFRYLVATEDPRKFLRWDHLGTMVFENAEYIEPELLYLKQSRNWTERWSNAITESHVGQPKPFASYPQSSGNLIHHAYHLCRFEEITGTPVESFDLVFEFGGGYGSMCRLVHNLGFKGHYVIFDFAEFSILQRFFLKSLGLPFEEPETLAGKPRGISTVSDFSELKKLLPALNKRSARALFIATWSLSETPVEFREQVLDLVAPFDAWLLAYQSQFGEVQNEDYFASVASERSDFRWWSLPIEHIPEQFYLIGQRMVERAKSADVDEVAQSTLTGARKAAERADLRLFVVIPTHNRWHEAAVSLDLLLRSTYQNFKVVLVADGCTDGTEQKCRAEFPEVDVLSGDGNLWWSGAINKGVDYALERGAEAIVWLNDDNRVEPETLARMVDSFLRTGERSVTCARTKSTATGIDEWIGEPPRWHREFGHWTAPDLSAADVALNHPPGGRGVLISARCFREIGLVDQKNFPHYWGDHDFHYRAMKAGYRYYLATAATIWNVPNENRPESNDLFSSKGARWFLFNRRSAMNMPTVRRLLKRHLPAREFRRTFYPILFRHLLWLSYGWLLQRPFLLKPLSKLKRSLVGQKPSISSHEHAGNPGAKIN